MTASPDGLLTGWDVVVAGASRGIGFAAVEMFARRGATVHALARSQQRLEETLSTLEVGNAIPHAVDVTDPSQLASLAKAFPQSADVRAVLSTVGANIPDRRLAQLTPAAWKGMVEVNLNSAFYLLHAFLPSLRQARGTFIAIGSASAVWPNFSGAAYQAAKVALHGLTRAASREEHGNGLRFTVVSPGLVDTEHLARRAVPPSKEALEQSLRAEDVASACYYIATLPPRVHVPEMVLLPTALQAPGQTEIPSAPA